MADPSVTAAEKIGEINTVSGQEAIVEEYKQTDGKCEKKSEHGGGGGDWECTSETCEECNLKTPTHFEDKKESIPLLVTSEHFLACWAFFDRMGRPKRMVAPMVEQSELPFRMMCRKYGSDLAYTPMFHSKVFISSESYRKRNFTTCPEDRPLLVQFCANDPEVFLEAAKYVENDCDGVDLNLGCPQGIAKRGNYGAFLQEKQDLIFQLINKLAKGLKVPITAKIRILDTEEETLKYALMVQEAGAAILAVHGRTRIQKGQLAGHANWEMIKKIKAALRIPVIANGSVERYEDIEECEKESNCDGLMSAGGLLRNPALFSGEVIKEVDLFEEYMQFAEKYPVRFSNVRAHMYKMLQKTLSTHNKYTQMMNVGKSIEEFRGVLDLIRENGDDTFLNTDLSANSWSLPSRHHKEKFIVTDKKGVQEEYVVEDMFPDDY